MLTDTTPVVTITAVNDTVCSGTYATFTATLSGSISTAVYDWQVNGFSLGSGAVFSYIPNDGDVVKCELFVFTPCSSTDTASIASNEVTLSVTPSVLPALSVSGSADTICAGTTVTFSVDSSVNAGTAPLFTWYRNGIVDGSGTTYSTTPLMGDAVFCMLTSNAICAIPPSVFSDTLTEYVRPLITPSITVTAFPGDTVCDGTSVSFSETDANTGSTQSYYWTVNGVSTGDTGTTLLYTPAYGDVVSCIVHGNQLCPAPDSAVSAPVTMILHHLLVPAVHIEATSDTVCAGTLVNFLSTVTNGGSHPDYHWSVNGIATGTDFGYTYTPMPGDTISCTVTSSEACLLVDTAVSNTIDMYVRPLLTPGISISAAPGDTVCAGTTVTFSAADTNTGTSPVYTWKKNGVNVGAGTSYAYSPANGDIITCVVHGNQLCPAPDSALSNTLTMTVNPVLTPGINLSMSTSDTICAGTTVTFTAHTVNGGTAPFYQWEVNGTDAGIDTFYTYIPTNGDIIACKLTSNAVCASVLNVYSAPDTMSVLPIIVPSVSVTSTAGDTVCAGTLVSYHATATGGGSTPVFNWIKNGASAASGATYSFTPVAGDTVWCQLVSSGPCAQPDTATTGAMVIVVNPVVVPVISITSVPGDTVCAGTSVSFTAAITNGGPTPAFQWKKNGINAGTDTAYTYVPVNGDTITFTLISSAICAAPDTLTTNPIIMTVNPVLTPSIIISPSTGDTICAGTAVTFNSIAVIGGTAPAYHWLLNGLPTTSTGSNYNYIPANGDTISCVMISNAICADHDTVLSNNVVMNVVPVIVPAISITPTSDTVCAGTPVTFHLSEANGGNSPMYKWMVNALPSGSDTLLNYVPANGDVVSCVLVSSSNCALPDTAISNTVTLVVDSVLSSSVSITGNPGADITSGEADTFTAVAINAGINPQFQWTVNGSTVAGATNAIFISATLHDNDTVRCTVINNSTCDTPAISVSNHIVIDLQNIPLAYDGVSLSPNPNNGTFTVTAHYTEKNGNTASIMIIDISGKQVWKSEVPVVNGVATATVDLSDLPAAMYMLRINYGDLDNSMKFVVHK